MEVPGNVVYSALLLVLLLQAKHVICDGPLQTAEMVYQKGIYAAPLGIVHAALHGAGTLAVFVALGFAWQACAVFAVVDTFLHYHIDFAKERLVRSQGWTFKDARFWWAIIVDHFLHNLTYLGFAAWIFG